MSTSSNGPRITKEEKRAHETMCVDADHDSHPRPGRLAHIGRSSTAGPTYAGANAVQDAAAVPGCPPGGHGAAEYQTAHAGRTPTCRSLTPLTRGQAGILGHG